MLKHDCFCFARGRTGHCVTWTLTINVYKQEMFDFEIYTMAYTFKKTQDQKKLDLAFNEDESRS